MVDGEPAGEVADVNVAVLELVLSVPAIDAAAAVVVVVTTSGGGGDSASGMRSTGSSFGAIFALLPGTAARMSHKSPTQLAAVSRTLFILVPPVPPVPVPSSGRALGDGGAPPPMDALLVALLLPPSEKLVVCSEWYRQGGGSLYFGERVVCVCVCDLLKWIVHIEH